MVPKLTIVETIGTKHFWIEPATKISNVMFEADPK
jgi:hypothetical protein